MGRSREATEAGEEADSDNSAFINSYGTTFKNDRTSNFVKSLILPEKRYQIMPSDASSGNADSGGIESVATHNRLLENDLRVGDDSQLREWGGSRLRDGLLSSFNWTVFSGP